VDRKDAIVAGMKRAGFPLEISTGMRFSGRGWNVEHQMIFHDEDERKSRNIDLVAHKAVDKQFLSFKRLNYTVVECKKSKSPWVFYTPNSSLLEKQIEVSAFRLKALSKPMPSLMQVRTLSAHSHYFSKKPTDRVGQASYVAFDVDMEGGKKRKKGHDSFFTALNQVLKAVRHQERETMSFFRYNITQGLLVVHYPVIVFDGDMYECVLDANEEPQLTETDYVKYDASFLGSWQQSVGQFAPEYFLVDVIGKEFLPQYINWLDEEMNRISDLKPA
jgi:hypothetical protein